MDPTGTLDSTTWAALALTLTVIGAVLSWVAWRRRGPAAGLRGLGFTLLPVAAWLTGTLRLVVAVVEEVVDWATRLVLSPTVWAGVVVLGVAVLLLVVSGAMRSRGVGVRERPGRQGRRDRRDEVASPTGRKAVGATEPAQAPLSGKAARRGAAKHPSDLEDMDDIEAILKKHGI